MAIELKCPKCGHHNIIGIGELMGKYARCESCFFLFKIMVEKPDYRKTDTGSKRDH